MFQNNPLLAQLKQQLHVETPQVEGQVRANEKGFGFLEIDSNTSHFLPPPQMKKVMHGDRITAYLRTENGREFAEVNTLVQPALTRFIARIKFNNGRLAIVPDHPQINLNINAKLLPSVSEHLKTLNNYNLKDGDWVVANIVNRPISVITDTAVSDTVVSGRTVTQAKPKDSFFFAEISEFITHKDDPRAPWWVTLAEQDLPRTAPILESRTEIDAKQQHIFENIQEDWQAIPFFTIDSASTQDMDDALALEQLDDANIVLSVAIADPTAYILPGSELDEMAKTRGFTHYLPGFNVPMLPRELADEVCSLMPDQLRSALVCKMVIQPDGEISQYSFHYAKIKSQHKLVYDVISDYLELKTDWLPDDLILQKQLSLLAEVTQRRSKWRELNALLFGDKPDFRFVLDKQGEVVAIVKDERRIANKMVEEAMIAANICAANFLKTKLGYGLFNVHKGFDAENIDNVIQVLKTFDITSTAENLLTLNGFTEVKRQIEKCSNPLIDNKLRRFQTFADITTDPAPHYGLGLEGYATWTSPIRKYSDMINHRLIKSILLNQASEKPDNLICEHLLACRKTSRQAERFISSWLYAQYLEKHVEPQTQFTGEIIEILRSGLRIRLDENGAVGFMPASLIHANRDEITCSQELGTVEIKGTVSYKLGDLIPVMISEVRMDTRSVIIKLAPETAAVID